MVTVAIGNSKPVSTVAMSPQRTPSGHATDPLGRWAVYVPLTRGAYKIVVPCPIQRQRTAFDRYLIQRPQLFRSHFRSMNLDRTKAKAPYHQ
jgi:hypothetical protein